MAFDRQEWQDHLVRQTAEQARTQRETLQGLGQAGLAAQAVTGSPEWDRVLSYVEGNRRALLERARQAKQALLAPGTVNAEDILRLKIQIAADDAVLVALKWVVELPAELMREGESARNLLKEIEVGPMDDDPSDPE